MLPIIAAKTTRFGRYFSAPNVSLPLSRLRESVLLTSSSRDEETGNVTEHVYPRHGSNGANTPISAPSEVTYSVVHHIRGRMRVRVPRLGYDAAFAQQLERTVIALGYVTSVRISIRARSMTVEYDTRSDVNRSQESGSLGQEVLRDLIECIRVAADVDVARNLSAEPDTETDERINYVERLGLPLLGLGLSAGVAAGLGVPGLLVGGAILASATPIFQRTAQGIQDEKRLTVDLLDATAIVLLTAQASFLAPAVIVGVIEGSEVTRDWTARRSRQAELNLLLAADRSVAVERDGSQQDLSIDDIVPGDIIFAYPGDEIAADGTVLEGEALVDQHSLTGDSALVARATGDQVFASSLVIEGHLRIRARQTGRDSHIATAQAEIAHAPKPDTRISNHARKVGNAAVVPTLMVAGAVGATSGSLPRVTGIVSLDLGTGMRVSAPIAVLAAQSNAAKQGVLVRSGRALEMLAEVDTIVFDKTATLTQGRAGVVGVQTSRPNIDRSQMLALAASAEQELDHPVAHAIVRHAHRLQSPLQRCTSWEYVTGMGVTATIDRQVVHVGNRQMMRDVGVDADAMELHDAARPEATHVYVARDGELLGRLQCADPVRDESADVIGRLERMGIAPILLSGDTLPVSQAVAMDLGIAPDNVYAEVLPQRKVDVVQAVKARGNTVAVVGDGVNDVAAMAHADVAISLGNATDLARETADIVLMDDDLRDLIVAIEISKHSMQVIRQNRALVIVPNVGAIAYAAMTVMNPIAGVVINNGSAFVAALNSLRPLRGPGKIVDR